MDHLLIAVVLAGEAPVFPYTFDARVSYQHADSTFGRKRNFDLDVNTIKPFN